MVSSRGKEFIASNFMHLLLNELFFSIPEINLKCVLFVVETFWRRIPFGGVGLMVGCIFVRVRGGGCSLHPTPDHC